MASIDRTAYPRLPHRLSDEELEAQYGPTDEETALTMSDPADLINLAIETLTRANVELPAFSTLDRIVGHLRQQVHAALYCLPLLWRAQATHRSILFRLLELLGIASATRDNALLDAWHYLLRHRNRRRSTLPCEIDPGFLSPGHG